MRTNTKPKTPPIFTHEGARAVHLTPEKALRRSIMTCMLWEDSFYEAGQDIGERIVDLTRLVPPAKIAALAIEARHEQHLRHAPLLLLKALAKNGTGKLIADTIERIISRADELAEFLAIYDDGKNKQTIPNQVKKGLARALAKFDQHALSKYNQKYNQKVAWKLSDVIRMIHPKPENKKQAKLWKSILDKTIKPADTWETALSGGADKKKTFERLMKSGELGYFALLRNLRNMLLAGVDIDLIRAQILARGHGAQHVLPFRYIAAARAAPSLEPEIDTALLESIGASHRLSGKTVVLVDVSHSMDDPISSKSDLRRVDAAAALASVINGDIRMFSFSNALVEVPPRRGMAGVDAIIKSQSHQGTRLFDAIAELNGKVEYDRIIVITDEQTEGGSISAGRYGFEQSQIKTLPAPKGLGYMINVGIEKNGVGYGRWTHIDGWSDSVIKFIAATENEQLVS